jgi:DinB superfamily
MRKIALALALSLVSAAAAGLPDAERRVLTDHLAKSSQEFLSSVDGLTPEQWSFQAGPDRWSIAQCAEHIALAEDFLRELVENKVLTAEPSPERIAERKQLDDKVLAMIVDRSFKAQAPEPLRPVDKFGSPQAAVEHFTQSRAMTVALAQGRDDLREHAAENPAFKELDAYQWLLFLSGHTLRHTAQIQEVKASPGFPK